MLDDQTLDVIEAVVSLAQREALSELDVSEGGLRIRVARSAPAGRRTERVSSPQEIPGEAVKSPLRGVFYGCPSPGGEPYVEVGQRVRAGQAVAVVEAMKVFNEVTSHVEGVVLAIPARDGALVEEGETLVLIEPEG